MSLFAKIMVVVNFILAVAFLAAAGTLLGAAEDYKGKYEDALKLAGTEKVRLEAQINEAQGKLAERQKTIGDLQAQKASAEGQLTTLKTSSDAVDQSNRQLRATYEKMADAQKDLQGKNSDLQGQLTGAQRDLSKTKAESAERNDKIRSLTDEVARLTQAVDTAEKSLAAQNAAVNALTGQLDESKTALDRYRKEKGSLTGGVAMKAVSGVVSAADPKVDVYILSVGEKDGVVAGYEFTIYRGSEYISTIVVDKVFPNLSSGRTKPGTKRKDVMAGDEAATNL